MRRVEIDHNWQKLRARNSHALGVQEIRFEGLKGFADGSISVSSPVFALCGQNGAGKTVILRGLVAALNWPSVAAHQHSALRLRGSTITVDLNTRNDLKQLVFNWSDPENPVANEDPRAVVFIETAQEVPRIQRYFQELQDLDEFMGAYASRDLNVKAISALSYATQKQYESVTIYEIDDIDSIEGVYVESIPYFKIKEGGIEYDTRTASLGELSILTLYWSVSTSQPGSFIILEEPETFLSEYSQSELLDILVSEASHRDLTLFYSTHSPRLVKDLKPEEFSFLYRTVTGVKVAGEAHRSRIKDDLGYNHRDARVIFVEDTFAVIVLRSFFEKIDPNFLRSVDIVGRGGSEALKRLRDLLPGDIKKLKFAYVFDGDMRDTIHSVGDDIAFLPSDMSPEKMLRQFAQTHPAELSLQLTLSIDDFEMKLASVNGRNDHDWFPELAKLCGYDLEHFVRIVLTSWISLPLNAANVTALVACLKDHLSR